MQPQGPQFQPYAPPGTPPGPQHHQSGACPKCNSPNVHQPSFTWWGGLLGPKLLNHTVCNSCSFGFNAKTGQSNQGAITIYLVVAAVISLALCAFVLSMG